MIMHEHKIEIKIKSKLKKILLVVAIFALSLFNFAKIRASSLDDCNQLQGIKKEQCEEYDQQIEDYQAVLDLKSQQQTSIENQIQVVNDQQTQNNLDLQQIENQLNQLNQQISDLENQIQTKEQEIGNYKLLLGGLMQAYYEYNQQGVMNVVLTDKNFSDILNQTDYSQQLGTRINEVLASLNSDKSDLENNQQQLSQKQDESETIQKNLESKGIYLQNNQIQNQTMLTQVQNDQQRYSQLLSNVEAQKAELFNVGGASNIGAVLASVSKYPAPKDHLASTSWYFSQWDNPQWPNDWANDPIGNSKYLMKDYGCAVTAVSMVFKKYGAKIDPGKMANEPIFSGALIEWPSSWSPDISLVSNSGHSGVDWNAVDNALSHNELVIVYIRKTNSSGGHYVVITGKDKNDYIVHDPYFGPNLYLSTSRALVGQLTPSGGTSIDQMIIYK